MGASVDQIVRHLFDAERELSVLSHFVGSAHSITCDGRTVSVLTRRIEELAQDIRAQLVPSV